MPLGVLFSSVLGIDGTPRRPTDRCWATSMDKIVRSELTNIARFFHFKIIIFVYDEQFRTNLIQTKSVVRCCYHVWFKFRSDIFFLSMRRVYPHNVDFATTFIYSVASAQILSVRGQRTTRYREEHRHDSRTVLQKLRFILVQKDNRTVCTNARLRVTCVENILPEFWNIRP